MRDIRDRAATIRPPNAPPSTQATPSGDTPIAMSGRVWVRACSEEGPIEVGDLLTSSSTSGVAMRAADPTRAFGTVIGKAMTELAHGEGLVLVLVGLR